MEPSKSGTCGISIACTHGYSSAMDLNLRKK